jgi:hypothetical protein
MLYEPSRKKWVRQRTLTTGVAGPVTQATLSQIAIIERPRVPRASNKAAVQAFLEQSS